MEHDINLNIHYTAPKEVWEKIEENIDTCEYTCNNKSIKEEVAR